METKNTVTINECGSIEITSGVCVFVRKRAAWKWEVYTVVQSGRLRGLQEFARYATEAETSTLDQAARSEAARLRLQACGKSAQGLIDTLISLGWSFDVVTRRFVGP
jgi:hypothetical protein